MRAYCPELECEWEGTTQGLVSHMRLVHGVESIKKAYSPMERDKLNPALMLPENEEEAKQIPPIDPSAKKLVIVGTKKGAEKMSEEKTETPTTDAKKEYEYECSGCGAEFDKPAKVAGSHYCPECGEELELE